MIVVKFGGTSVKNPEALKQMASIVASHAAEHPLIVVVSAFGGVTDLLQQITNEALAKKTTYTNGLDQITARTEENLSFWNADSSTREAVQQILSRLSDSAMALYEGTESTEAVSNEILVTGEALSSTVISGYLNALGTSNSLEDSRNYITAMHVGRRVKVDYAATYSALQELKERKGVLVMPGFMARTPEGDITTLGRGGSDFSAALIANGVSADELYIYTDVSGIYTADPRFVRQVKPVDTLSYEEALELSHFGAKVLYAPSVQPAFEKKIPLKVKNTFDPSAKGSLITSSDLITNKETVIGISHLNNVSLITAEGADLIGQRGFTTRFFETFSQHNINIILITQASSEYSLCVAIDSGDADTAQQALSERFETEIRTGRMKPFRIESQLSIVALVGENMKSHTGISGKLFSSLGANHINIVAIAQGSSELNISAVIKKVDEHKALNALHEGFFESDLMVLHLFVVGVGLIGKTLLKQIDAAAEYLKTKRGLEIRVVALSNSRKMIFNEKGIDLNNWQAVLSESDDTADIEAFIKQMKALNLRNSIFIDNTANAEIPKHYADILSGSISVSTPNKIAASSPFSNYQTLKALADSKGVRYAFETNVGAGLPILTTLNDLIASGDEILKIEGVLSGSLSYIFNNFKAGESFHDIVKKAQELGFTEPDPREDLGGKDVARKLLILAREAGLNMEAEDIEIEPFLPQACFDAPTVDDFFETLKTYNTTFENMVNEAENEDKKLRIIATLNGTKASISLQSVDATNPFFGLSGSDNMISFTTKRYRERPLVVRGPGAGAEVTAAGVFAEIISIATYLA